MRIKSVVIADITLATTKIMSLLVIAILIITISAMFNVWSIGVGIGARKDDTKSKFGIIRIIAISQLHNNH